MGDTLYLITLFPLVGFLINGLLGRYLTDRQSGLVASTAIFGSFIVSLINFMDLLQAPVEARRFMLPLFDWISVGDLNIQVGYLFDPLTAVMTLVVTGVGLLIHIYSMGYMHGDKGVRRYFAFLNLFTFMMLNLVLADNLVLLFLGWEGVGLCSYLLIGFWFEDEAKAAAGMKAFIFNRIGDAGFIIAMVLLYHYYGTLTMVRIEQAAPVLNVSTTVVTAITLLLFVGATGKSAQIPLFVWLPDAMAGPTPVSALIHAATMVTAGVYLIARNAVLFSLAPTTMAVIAGIGVVTAFVAAIIAITQTDIKKVLAYSTISQLGYMFMAVGVGAFSAGIFHLMTHAFFKALLFLGAGSVINGMHHEQDMQKMGGLKESMPTTHLTMLIAVLAISGIPGLSGFFSKDEILWGAYASAGGFNWVWMLGIITAGLTAFYMFRLLFMTFYGKKHWHGSVEARESPSVMVQPLMLLAFLSILGGYVGIPEVLGGHNLFHQWLEPVLPAMKLGFTGGVDLHSLELLLMVVSVSVALGGVWFAHRIYMREPSLAEQLAEKNQAAYKLSYNKFYLDEIYEFLVVRPLKSFSNILWKWVDEKGIDGFVNGSSRSILVASGIIRRMQSGLIQHYAAVVLMGVIFIMIYMALA